MRQGRGIVLLAAAPSTRNGAQTQRPLAIVVIVSRGAIVLPTAVLQVVRSYLLHRWVHLAEDPAMQLTRRIE